MTCEVHECGREAVVEVVGWGTGREGMMCCPAHAREAHRDGASVDLIFDEEYDHGVPGRACAECNCAWPATEPDEENWHHDFECSQA